MASEYEAQRTSESLERIAVALETIAERLSGEVTTPPPREFPPAPEGRRL